MVQALIFIILGMSFIVSSYLWFNYINKLAKNGIRAEGIIFEIEKQVSTDSNGILRIPVIRFLTKKDEWITEKPNQGITSTFKRIGDKVSIIYDPDDPKSFIIDSKFNSFIFPILLVIGILAFVFGLYKIYIS